MITLNNGVLLGVIIPTPVPVPRVTVLLENTNIRAGDATSYRVVRTASAGQTFEVAGQSANCTWLQVVESGSVIGWISGNPAYVAIDQPCVSLPQILPTPRPAATLQVVAQGCATIINQFGSSVRVDLQRNNGWRDAITLAANARRFYCVNPGRYTITITSPMRSDSFSLPLVVRGGENYDIPLRLP